MHEERIYNLVLSPEMTWEGLLKDIVRKENMDPWNIDVIKIADKYTEVVKGLKFPDFHLSGKMILSAAILLKMKSDLLKPHQLVRYNYYLSDFAGAIDLGNIFNKTEHLEIPEDFGIIPKLNPIRTRKINIDELVDALNKAMEVQMRRNSRWERRDKIQLQKNKFKASDIGKRIKTIHSRIMAFFGRVKKDEITFTELNPSKDRKDIIWTFIPLLHLANTQKVNLRQEENFGEIYIGKR